MPFCAWTHPPGLPLDLPSLSQFCFGGEAMQESQSRTILFVAIAQFVPLVLFPWGLTVGSVVAIVILLALSGFLGWVLLRRKAWGVTLTIFVQGLNVIVRLITLFANVFDEASGVDVGFLITYVASAALSLYLLSTIDKPEVRLLFGS
jgi:hypothetical protein